MTRSDSTSRARAGDRRCADDAGFTVAEVLASIALFTIVAVSATAGLVSAVTSTTRTQDRVAATNLARQEIERLRLQNSTGAQLDSAVQTVTLHATQFTVTPTLTPAASANCVAGAARAATVLVTWNGSPARGVRLDTVLAC
jgi:type II secretory pathway pseudopilin PulG